MRLRNGKRNISRQRSYDTFSRRTTLLSTSFVILYVAIRPVLLAHQDEEWDSNSTRSLLENQPDSPSTPKMKDVTTSQDNFNLAKSQSFGYFDDISDKNWKRAQEIHAKMFPNHASRLGQYSNAVEVKDKVKELKLSNHWYAQNFHEEFHCPLAQRVPTDGDGDGPKWICDPHRLKHKKDCLVYSVGSNGKAEFETGVRDEIGSHCEIHTFDVEIWNQRNGNFKEALKGISSFHHWGFGTEEQAEKQPKTFKTLKQTMKELGHVNRTIDLFKIDCEWCEWFTFEQWIQQDIRQILVETHNAPMPNAQDFFFKLHDSGFVIFNKEANYQNSGGGVEYGFIKLSTDFFVDRSVYDTSSLSRMD